MSITVEIFLESYLYCINGGLEPRQKTSAVEIQEAVSEKTDHWFYFENSIFLIRWDFEAFT